MYYKKHLHNEHTLFLFFSLCYLTAYQSTHTASGTVSDLATVHHVGHDSEYVQTLSSFIQKLQAS